MFGQLRGNLGVEKRNFDLKLWTCCLHLALVGMCIQYIAYNYMQVDTTYAYGTYLYAHHTIRTDVYGVDPRGTTIQVATITTALLLLEYSNTLYTGLFILASYLIPGYIDLGL